MAQKDIQLNYHSNLAEDFIPFANAIPSKLLNANGAAVLAWFNKWDLQTSPGDRVTTLFQHWWLRLTKLAASETNSTYWDNPAFVYNALASDATGHSDPACTSHKGCVPLSFPQFHCSSPCHAS